jgi:hypothetical protein
LLTLPTSIWRKLNPAARSSRQLQTAFGCLPRDRLRPPDLGEIPRDPSDLDKMKPVTSTVDLGIAYDATVDFALQNARYVALRWALSNNRVRPVAIAEVSIFNNEASDSTAVTLAASDPPPPDPVQGLPLIVSVSP